VKDETDRVKDRLELSSRFRPLAAAIVLGSLAAVTSGGCGALLLLGGAGTSAIAFATGELQSTEDTALSDLDLACGEAVGRLGYSEIEITREADRVRYRAVSAGGEPVDIRLKAVGPTRTELRIRIGVFGDEAISRLVLEEIHQSL
jgi:hypothetical protein